jgi:hypothetical protein
MEFRQVVLEPLQGKLNGAVIQAMPDEAVTKLVGTGNAVDAWRRLVEPTDVVGVKTNAWARLPTPAELEAAIRRRVLDAGVAEKNLDIADRGVLSNPIFLNATALVNVRPLRTHHWAGVGTCLKNYIPFVSNRPSYHPDGCAALGKIWTLPIVKCGELEPRRRKRCRSANLEIATWRFRLSGWAACP